MNCKKKVSIIVPCYKQADYLSETLDSVLAQTYSNWECIIVNDGSPDNTEEIANHYLEKDNRFKYVFQTNKGLASARNVGIENSVGEYILPLDSDDKIAPSYVEKAIHHFEEYPETKLVYCKADRFGEENCHWNLEPYVYERFIWRNCIFCTAMYKRKDYDNTNGYNPNMVHGYEDWDFWLQLLTPYDTVFCINEVLFHYRIKKESMRTEHNKYITNSHIQIYRNHPHIYEQHAQNIISIQNDLMHYKELYSSITSSLLYKVGKKLHLLY